MNKKEFGKRIQKVRKIICQKKQSEKKEKEDAAKQR